MGLLVPGRQNNGLWKQHVPDITHLWVSS